MSDTEAWVDNQGDVWRLGDDGLMHSYETAPFPREYVEKKWGPLRPVPPRSKVSAEESCACGHLWTDHKIDEGCWHGWAHHPDGLVKTSGCECLLAHSRLSR